jgi:protoporphyrinogen oxidase
MDKYKYLILGAGPSGLSFANRLLANGEKSFLVLEKEAEAGGLCRSKEVDGSPLDIGGGHFLDLKKEEVLKFIFEFLPKKEWNIFKRISTIKLDDCEIDYPFEANIWQFPVKKQIEYLLSISKTGSSRNEKMPAKFIDWIFWKLGDKIAQDYMVPYNQKIWSMDLNRLGTYWLYKLPDVSLEETLESCLERKPAGKMPAHAQFLYPKKYGYGEVWKRMAQKLGSKILYNTSVKELDIKKKIINQSFSASQIISTIPWLEYKFTEKIPADIKKAFSFLEYNSVRISYFPKNQKTKAHWTYYPDLSIPHHRSLFRHNFFPKAKGYWTEMNEKRASLIKEKADYFYTNQYAYPLNTIQKPKAIKKVQDYFSQKQIIGLGRWGEWEHMNSDVAVEKGIALADQLLKKDKK